MFVTKLVAAYSGGFSLAIARLSLLGVLVSILVGCGGASKPLDFSLTGSMTALPNPSDPGQAVALTFTGTHTMNAESNFTSNGNMTPYFHKGNDSGGRSIDGTITLHPTVTETYTLKLFGVANNTMNLTATATVRPTGQKYLVVGDPSDPDVASAINALQPLSTSPVVVQSTIPAPSSAVDAILIDHSGNFGPADIPTVRAYLQQGKGVIFVRAAPRLLASGDATSTAVNNVAAIQSWFGAGPTQRNSSGNTHVNDSVVFVPVPITIAESFSADLSPGYNFDLPNPGVDIVSDDPGSPTHFNIFIFGYHSPDGGRIYYQSGTSFLDDAFMLAAGARWAATGP